jgi:hypothetical protein
MLNISKQIYAAWNGTPAVNALPLAEIIPEGSASNEKKKLDSVTAKFTNLFEHENIPLPGFTLHEKNMRGQYSGDTTWNIIDPRGFLVKITSDNLIDILRVTGITEGLVQEKCVWARSNSETKLKLVPITSPDYLDAVQNTTLLEEKVNISDVQIGDTVLMQNGSTGTYCGVLSLYGSFGFKYNTNVLKPQMYPRRQIVEVKPNKFIYQTDLKILKVLDKTTTPLTREESAERLDKLLSKTSTGFSVSPHFDAHSNNDVKHVSVHSVSKVKITFERIDRSAAEALFYTAQNKSDQGLMLFEKLAGEQCIIDFPYFYNNSGPAVSPMSFSTERVLTMDLSPTESLELTDRKQFWGRNATGDIEALDNFENIYKIVKHVKNKTYI